MTGERVENALDIFACIVAKTPKGEAMLLVPIWKRLETELDALRDAEDLVSLALIRVKTLVEASST